MQIFVKLLTGKMITLNVTGTDTILQVKQKVDAAEQIPAARQKLIYAGNNLDDAKTLKDYDIPKESTLYLIASAAPPPEPGPKPDGPLTITVKTGNADTFLLTVSKTTKVSELKTQIAAKSSIPVAAQQLSHGPKTLDDANTLEACGIVSDTMVTVLSVLKGGLIH